MTDFSQITDRCGIGDDHSHLEAELLESFKLLLDLFECETLIDAMFFQEAIQFVAGLKTEQTTEFRLREMAALVLFESESFEGPAREIAFGLAEPGSNVVGDVNGQLHQPSSYRSVESNRKGQDRSRPALKIRSWRWAIRVINQSHGYRGVVPAEDGK